MLVCKIFTERGFIPSPEIIPHASKSQEIGRQISIPRDLLGQFLAARRRIRQID
jgi:hypothetical protein